MKIYENVTELIGHTPLMEVKNLESESQLKAKVLVKLEYFNPAGSVKDRVALNMIEDAEKRRTYQDRAPLSLNRPVEIQESGWRQLLLSRGYKAIICDAGDNEYRTEETPARIWSKDRARRKKQGNVRRYRESGGAGERNGKFDCSWAVCQ